MGSVRPLLAAFSFVVVAGCASKSSPRGDDVAPADTEAPDSAAPEDLAGGDGVIPPADGAGDGDTAVAGDTIMPDSGDTEVPEVGDAGDAVSPDAGDTGDVRPGEVPLTACRSGTSDWVALPEASGVALLPEGRYVLVADSGNGGRALVIDEAAGLSLPLTLPLGDAGDDVEGLEAAPDGRVFGLTSAGWLRAWTIAVEGGEASAELVFGPVAVAPAGAWACDRREVNCGPNFEGICLHPAPSPGLEGAAGCAGWAASKARGELVCLRAEGAGYRVDAEVRIAVAPADQLSGCAYELTPPYRLVVGGNIFSGDRLWEVALGGAAGETTIIALPDGGAGNQEAVLVLPGPALRSFGDLQELGEGQSPRVPFACR